MIPELNINNETTTLNRRNFIKTGAAALASISLVDLSAGGNASREKLFVKSFSSPDDLARYTRLDALKQPLLMAHRAGYSPQGVWPECAIESAEKVIRKGPAMIEIDVRTTSDGELVCVHDWKLDRGTTGKGPVGELSANQIAELYLKDALGNVTDFHIPTLDEFLEWGKNGALLWLDLKDASPEIVVAKIHEHTAESRVIVSAYGLEMVKTFLKLSPELVYFIPLIEKKGLPDVDSVLKVGVNPNNMIGFAGWYIPNIKAVTELNELNIPALLDLSGADRNLLPSQLDKRLYQNAFNEGFPLMNTDQYEKVLQLLGINDWI